MIKTMFAQTRFALGFPSIEADKLKVAIRRVVPCPSMR